MKLVYLLPVFLILLAPCAQALQEPNITFIPERFSKDASVIVIADVGEVGSARVDWRLLPSLSFGLLPKVGDNFYCYFSNSDPKSNCGPSPFTETTIGLSPYTLIVNAVDSVGGVQNTSVQFHTGSITLLPTTQILNNTLKMVVAARGALPTRVLYSIYRTDLTPVMLKKELIYDITTDRFSGQETLGYGDYYLAMWAYVGTESSPDDFGGDLLRVTIGEPEAAPEEDVLVSDSVNLDILINMGQHFEQTGFKVTNYGTETLTDLSVTVPAALSEYLSVRLDSTYMSSNDTIFATVVLDRVEASMDINTMAGIYSGTTRVGRIPIRIGVSVLGAAIGCETAADGSLCMGGVCCFGSCVKGGVCCSDFDCGIGQSCSNFECISATARRCTTGECFSGTSGVDCPSGSEYTYETCTTTLGNPGVCCEMADPCSGMSDMETCPGGICCSESCIDDGECCSDFDCPLGESCKDYQCTSAAAAPKECSVGMCYAGTGCPADRTFSGETCTTLAGQSGVCCERAEAPAGPGIGDMGDIMPLIIIIAVVAVAAVGAYFALNKMKGKGGGGRKKLEKELEEEY